MLPGTYQVAIDSATVPSNYVNTFDFDGNSDENSGLIILSAGDNNLALDFGFAQPDGSQGGVTPNLAFTGSTTSTLVFGGLFLLIAGFLVARRSTIDEPGRSKKVGANFD